MFNKFKIKFATLSIIMWITILALAVAFFMSIFKVNLSLNNEKKVIDRQTEFISLGYSVAEASDYLTTEVRKYVVTFDKIHLDNYWNEVYVKKTRENVLERLKEIKAPSDELKLILESKENSDELISTETRAMKLVLSAQGVPEDKMYPDVAKFKLNKEDELLSANEKFVKARELIFDKSYDEAKKKIMDPIYLFIKYTNERSGNEMNKALSDSKMVLSFLFPMAFFIFASIGLLLLLFDLLVGKPIRQYSKSIKGLEDKNMLVPSSLIETNILAEAYNNVKLKSQYLEELTNKLDSLSKTDTLTGLYNRRYMVERISEEIKKYKNFNRYSDVFSIIIADIDFFKKVNDNYGHNCGDMVLKQMGEILCSSIRYNDSAARWGGEEFLLLLPNTDSDGALLMAERIRKRIEEMKFHYEGIEFNITVTFGIAQFDGELSIDELIKAADNALYEGKNKGRNCVVRHR